VSYFIHSKASICPSQCQVSAETLFVTRHGVNKEKVKGIWTMGMLLLKWKSDGFKSSRPVWGSWEALRPKKEVD
jgi:hypothetical protein